MEHQVINFDDYRGDKLKLARMAVGLSCEELADKIGKTKQFVSKMEKGFKPTEQVLELIANALKITPDFLYSERKYALAISEVKSHELKLSQIVFWLGQRYLISLYLQ